MVIDARSVDRDKVQAEVCIVGAGAASIALARGVDLLLERILASIGATGGCRSRDVRLLFKQIHRAVRQDYTIRLKGWILSQTEAPVCTLAALV